MIKNARDLAVTVLQDIFENDAYANIALDRTFRDPENAHFSELDRHFVTALVYGVVGKKELLDWYLQPFLKREPKPWLRALFQMTIYQIVLMDKVPTSAAVDEAVKIAKARDGQQTANFVNAVLRNFMRSGREDELPKDWETRYSMPKNIMDKLVKQFGGKRTGEILESLESPSKASVRVNTSLSTIEEVKEELEAAGYELTKSELSPVGLTAKQGNFAGTEAFQAGRITIQDETSQLVALALGASNSDQVLDACAAPGGKTTQIAESLGETGQVTALDIYEHKLKLVEENAERLHLSDKIKTLQLDAREVGNYFPAESFDKILVDAPCSGLGLMRRKPDIKYRKESHDFANLAELQLEILESSLQALKKNGIIVYSTCTLVDEENFNVVKLLLEKHPEVEQVKLEHEKTDIMVDNCLFISPELYQTDGFFIAKFRKK